MLAGQSHPLIVMNLAKLFLAGVVVALLSARGSAQVVWNESVDGDISGARLSPTSLGTLGTGTYSVIGTLGGGELDYFTFTLGPGTQLSALMLSTYVSADSTAFIGLQAGSVFTESNASPNVANLLGYTHFGPAVLGTDILDNIGTGSGAIGFTGTLPGPTYTFWVQQLGASTSYQFDLVVIPEPGTYAAVAGGLAFGLAVWRRNQRPRMKA